MLKILLICMLIFNNVFCSTLLINKNNLLNIEKEETLIESLDKIKNNLFTNENLNNEKEFKNILRIIKNEEKEIDLYSDSQKNIDELNLKININYKNKNTLAIIRDDIKLNFYKNRVEFLNFLNTIIKSRKEFKTENDISNIIENNSNMINKDLDIKYLEKYYEIKNKNIDEITKIEQDIIIHYDEYFQEKNLFLYINKYLNSNKIDLVKHNLIKEKFNMIYLKKIINNELNQRYYISDLNNTMYFATKLSFGDLVIAILGSLLILSLRYLFLPITFKFIKNENIKIRTYIIKSLEKPIKNILFVLSFDVFINLIHNEQFELNKFSILFNSLYIYFVMIIIYNLINKGLEFYSDDIFNKYPNLRIEMVLFTKRMLIIILFITFLLILLTNLGVNLIALAGGLGILGIGLGLAFKDVFSNFFGSIMILIDKPFSPGDWIAYKDGEGTVIEIGMRGTRIRTFDNGEITVPNSNLSNNTITNWSKREIGRRIKIELPISYECSNENIKNLIYEIETMLLNHNGIINVNNFDLNSYKQKSKELLMNLEHNLGIKSSLMVNLTEFSENGKIINIYCFSKTIDWKEWRDITEDILFKIDELLLKNNCKIFKKNENPNINLDEFKLMLENIK